MLVFLGSSVNASNEEISTADYKISQNCNECPINITVHDAWDLLTDSGNGIQIPIDVRSEQEWNYGFIDTPFPECPRWYVYDEFQYNETFFEQSIIRPLIFHALPLKQLNNVAQRASKCELRSSCRRPRTVGTTARSTLAKL